MSTPPEVRELINDLAGDVDDAYYGIEHSGPAYNAEQGWTAARFLARKLLRKGWRKGGVNFLPRRPYGTVTCYDPDWHERCEV